MGAVSVFGNHSEGTGDAAERLHISVAKDTLFSWLHQTYTQLLRSTGKGACQRLHATMQKSAIKPSLSLGTARMIESSSCSRGRSCT